MTRTMLRITLELVEERDTEPPRHDATVTGAEVEESSVVRALPVLAKCGGEVVPFRKVAR
jgi:hypothetical protein